jgi:hypothetical protein
MTQSGHSGVTQSSRVHSTGNSIRDLVKSFKTRPELFIYSCGSKIVFAWELVGLCEWCQQSLERVTAFGGRRAIGIRDRLAAKGSVGLPRFARPARITSMVPIVGCLSRTMVGCPHRCPIKWAI